MPTNNKFLQILRNFDSTSREQAAGKLGTVAQGNLYHAGTPVVAFYTAKTRSFANRSAAKTYGTDATRTYKALLGIMGAQQGDIEIFDIQTSVEAILGGANQITTSANSVFPSKTWDFTSLGGVQVVIEQMDEVLTTEIGNLKTRINSIHTIMGQPEETYTAPSGSTYLGNATSLQGEINALDSALAGLASQVGGNTISNTDKSITVTTTTNEQTHSTSTDVHVNIDHANEHVIELGDNGLYTNIAIKKVVASGQGGGAEGAPSANEVVGTLETNVKEAFQLIATDGSQLGQQINIYKDSSLKEVYLGADSDTIDASTGVITKNTVTDPQSMNFAYQLADGTYSLTKIDVSNFLTESEFGDGLTVSGAGVVSVNAGNGLEIDSTSKAVNVKIDSTNDSNNYLSVGANGVAFNGNAIADAIENAATTLTTVAAGTETTADGTDFIKVVGTQQADGHTDYAVSTKGIKDYVATQLANTSIDADGDGVFIDADVDGTDNKKINVTGIYGVFNTPTAGSNTLSATTNGIAKAGDVATAVNTVVGNLDGSATATAASGNVYTVLTSVTETDGIIAKGGEVTLAAVAKTGAAADVSYDTTDSGMTATTVQDAIDELKSDTLAATTEVVGEAQAPDPTANPAVPAGNGVYVTKTTDQTDDHTIYTVAIDVFDCGTY